MNSVLRQIAVAMLGLVLVVGLSACSLVPKKLKDTEVADAVRANVLQPKGITAATVNCPAETKAKKGTAIKCTVNSGSDSGTVTATVLDSSGKLGRYQAEVDPIQVSVIEQKALDKGRGEGIVGDVKCPDSSKPRAGAVFLCTARIAGSGIGAVVVRQVDEASNVEVSIQRRKLRTAQIEANVARVLRRRGINATVTCPPRVTSQRGSKFRCRVRNPANGRTLTIEATQIDEEGNFRLRVVK